MTLRATNPLALRILQCLAGITIAASAAACVMEAEDRLLDDSVGSTGQEVQTLADALSCVESYAMSNTCDWSHWTEMYLTCQTYAFGAMDDDDYLLNIVQAGECTGANWPSYAAIIEYRDSAPQTVTESLDCVSQFASLGACDWSHWTEMYLTCDTYAFAAMDDDDYLLNIVQAGECTGANWPSYAAIIEYRDSAPQTVTESLDCVSQFVSLGTCDWSHWTEMYLTCQTYAFAAMDDDDYLLNIVQAGECTGANWPQISALIEYRAAPPLILDNLVSNVDESTTTVTFMDTFAAAPAVFAAMQTFNGSDPSDARLGPVNTSGFGVFVQEEQSSDSEVAHNDEVIGFLALEPGVIIDEDGHTIGEVGTLSLTQNNAGEWFTLDSYLGTYSSPVVIMMTNTVNGSHACHIRLNNVTSTSFSYQLEEWDYQDGTHANETVVYLILEAGSHRLPNGALLQATTGTIDHVAQAVSFPASHGATPVVLSQTQTVNGGAAVVTRQQNVSTSSVDVHLQEEEAADGTHSAESVAVVSYGI